MRFAAVVVVGLVACQQPKSFVEVQNHRPHSVHVELALSDGSGRWLLEIAAHGRAGVLFFPDRESHVIAHVDGLPVAGAGYFEAEFSSPACFVVDVQSVHPATSCAVSQ